MDTDTPAAPLSTGMMRTDDESGEAGSAQDEEVRAVMASSPNWWRRLGRDSAYTLTSFPLAVVAVCLVSVLVAVGAGLALIFVGLPILALGLLTARGFAYVERRRLSRLLGTPMAHPTYLVSRPGDSLLHRLTRAARDAQSWLDVLWTVVAVFTATIAWTIAVVWWATALGGTTYGIWEQTIPRGSGPVTLASLLGFGPSEHADILVISAFGVFALLTLPFALRAAAVLHSTMGRDLLCGRAELQQQVRRSEAGRTAGRVAEAESLRRLERDIHDGPQQRLVRLSMDLGRARAQLDNDPEQARATIEGALSQTRETVDELRSLSRGIAPPVLVDRGLEAALREAVARSVVPTTLTYSAPANLPAHIESAIYFIVAECLTNVAKHSGARSAWVSVEVRDDEAVVVVEDDGQAADGLLDITSPRGGPTVIRTELPCG